MRNAKLNRIATTAAMALTALAALLLAAVVAGGPIEVPGLVVDRLTGVLGRLMVIPEQYPDLKSNQNFLALQSQLEGTENRIAVARRDYIETVRAYNTELRTIPGRWIAAIVYPDAKPMETFTATAGSDRPPPVKF